MKAAAELGGRLTALQRSLLEQSADKYLPDDYAKTVSGIEEVRKLCEKGDLPEARKRADALAQAIAQLSSTLQERLARLDAARKDADQALREAEAAGASRWAVAAKIQADDLYVQGSEALRAYNLDGAETSWRSALRAADDVLRLVRDAKAKSAVPAAETPPRSGLGAATDQLLCLAESGTPEQIQEVLRERADPNAADFAGRTVLMLASARNPDPRIIAVLVKGGARINARGANGWTALMMAAYRNPNPAVVESLLSLGADAGMRSPAGRTAADYAQDNQNLAGSAAYSRLRADGR